MYELGLFICLIKCLMGISKLKFEEGLVGRGVLALKKKWLLWGSAHSCGDVRSVSKAESSKDHIISLLRNRLDYLFDSALSGLGLEECPKPELRESSCCLDIQESEENYALCMEVREGAEEHIHISLECDQLTIQYDKHRESIAIEEEQLMDNEAGVFRRTISLPKDADRDAITAFIERNLLTISIAKCDEAACLPRTIKIQKR